MKKKRKSSKIKTDNITVINIKQSRNLKHKYRERNIKSNKVFDNHSDIIKIKNEFNTKENLNTKNLNDPGLNNVLKEYFRVGEYFKKDKNQKEALALLKKILKDTPPSEMYTMMDFLKNLLSAESLKTKKINKNKAGIPKTSNDKVTER